VQVEQVEQVEQTGKRRYSYGTAIALAVVLLVPVMAAAFYWQELSIYWRLRGWDTAAVRQTMERFVREAHDGQPSAGDLLDPAWAHPTLESGKFVGVSQSSARGPQTTRVTAFIPDRTIKDCAARIKYRSGVFQADVQYPNGQWAEFDVDRVQGALRIRKVSPSLTATRPPVQPWD